MKNKKRSQSTIKTRSIGLLSAAVMSLSLLVNPIGVSAEGAYIRPDDTAGVQNTDLSYSAAKARKLNYNLPGAPSTSLSYYSRKNITVNGSQLSEPAAVINGITYVPLKAFTAAVAGAKYSYSSSVSTVKASGLLLTAANGGYVIYANDRPLFSFSPTVRMTNGAVYVPASALERAMGIKRTSENSSSVKFGGSYSPLIPASRYYREDEVYWLSKIISAESSGESLLGQIAVGDVILNRVKSNQFPNTIYGVIFDRKWGVQFSPTADGRIYNSPTYTATLAAKICLEGISLSDNAIYFLNPRAASSNWIVNNRNYLYTIGNHDFYD